MARVVYSLLLAPITSAASAQAPQPSPPPQTPSAAGAQIMTSIPAEQHDRYSLVQAECLRSNDNKIGEIMDVLVDREGKIAALIVGAGGFLGHGREGRSGPVQRVQVTSKNNNKWYLVMNTTKDALKSAKGFKYDRNAMTWMPEDAPATTGTPASPPPSPRPNR